MLQKNPLFLFPISYFGSTEDTHEQLPESDEWSCPFVLDLENADAFPPRIGSFLFWTDNISSDFSEEDI